MNFKFQIGRIFSIPLLPVLYFHGKKIMREVPKLPEASGKDGLVKANFDKEMKVLFIGESTIAGVGVKTQEEGFCGSFARQFSDLCQCNIQWQVYARSGYTIQRMRKKLLPKIVEKSFDLIVIGAGANDAFELNTPAKWRLHTIEFIRSLEDSFGLTPVVFCNMPPIKEFPAFSGLTKLIIGNLIEILGVELADVVKNYDHVHYNAKIISLKKWIHFVEPNSQNKKFFSDGVHPSKLTYEIWGQRMAKWVFDNVNI